MSISEVLGPQHRVELSAGPISYREVGSGPVLVFVHGVFVNGDLWRKVVPELATDFRCITPDWPLGGHGEAMKPDADLSTPGIARIVADFLAALDLTDVTLIANDTGGAVSQLVMADHRERLGKTVLSSCDAFETYPPKAFAYLKLLPRIPGATALVANTLRIRALHRLPIAFGWVMRDKLPAAIADSFTRPMLRADIRRDATKLCRGIDPADTIAAAERLRDFPHPVLLAWAADDKLFPWSLGERLAAVLPKAELRAVPNSMTFVAEDNPAALVALVREFLTG